MVVTVLVVQEVVEMELMIILFPQVLLVILILVEVEVAKVVVITILLQVDLVE